MTNFLLYIDTCIYFINGKFNLKEKFQKIGKQSLFISEITNSMILLTRNEKHFKRLKNLKYENWVDD